MKKLSSSIVIVFVMMVGSVRSSALSYDFKKANGKIEFATKGWPSLITIKGAGKGVVGTLTEKEGKLSGDLTFQLATLKTGIDLRDTHMKDNYLEVKKFPVAKLSVKNLPIPAKLAGKITFKGNMTVHGQTKEVTVTATLSSTKDPKSFKIDAEIPMKLTDYKIAIPSYKGITVAEKVSVTFRSKVLKTNGVKKSANKKK